MHAIAEIQKAIRFFRLYPHEHPFCAEGLERSHARLSDFTQAHGTLEVEVGRDGLFWEGESLLPEADQVQSSDLNVLLFMEGVRELSFEPSLSADDLRRLIEILSASYTEGEGGGAFADDLLTALWREEFTGFGFKVFDPLAANFARTMDEDGALGAIAGRIQELAAEFGVSEGETQRDPIWVRHPGDSPSGEAPGASGEEDATSWATRPERAIQFLESDAGAERRALLAELLDPSVDDRLGRAAEVVRWVIRAAPELVAEQDSIRFVAGSTSHILGQGDLPQALRLSEVRGQDSLARAVARELSGEEGIAGLALALAARAQEVDPQTLSEEGGRYLELLDPETALPNVCARFAEEQDRAVRGVLERYLAQHVQAIAPWLLERGRGEDPAAAREAVALLVQGGDQGPTREALRSLARGQGPAREQAAEALEKLSGADERRRLLEIVLEGPVRSDRLNALGALDASVRTYEGLLPLVEGDRLLERDGEEQAATLDLLVRAGGVRARVALEKLSTRRLPMFRQRAETERLKKLAAHTLEGLARRKENS